MQCGFWIVLQEQSNERGKSIVVVNGNLEGASFC